MEVKLFSQTCDKARDVPHLSWPDYRIYNRSVHNPPHFVMAGQFNVSYALGKQKPQQSYKHESCVSIFWHRDVLSFQSYFTVTGFGLYSWIFRLQICQFVSTM